MFSAIKDDSPLAILSLDLFWARADIAFRCSTMNLCRTLLALLIALSVATVPAVGMTMRNADPTSKLAEMAMSDVAADMSDCCPDSKAPCGMPVEQCPAYSCAQSVTISSISAPQVTLPLFPADKPAAFAGGVFHPRTSGPPFRPPRA